MAPITANTISETLETALSNSQVQPKDKEHAVQQIWQLVLPLLEIIAELQETNARLQRNVDIQAHDIEEFQEQLHALREEINKIDTAANSLASSAVSSLASSPATSTASTPMRHEQQVHQIIDTANKKFDELEQKLDLIKSRASSVASSAATSTFTTPAKQHGGVSPRVLHRRLQQIPSSPYSTEQLDSPLGTIVTPHFNNYLSRTGTNPTLEPTDDGNNKDPLEGKSSTDKVKILLADGERAAQQNVMLEKYLKDNTPHTSLTVIIVAMIVGGVAGFLIAKKKYGG